MKSKSTLLNQALHSLESFGNRENVGNITSPQGLNEVFNDFKIPNEGLNDATLLQNIEKYLEYSVNTGSGKFMNQLFGGRDEVGVIGELIAAFTNTTMATFEMAPVASLIELKIIEIIANLAGFKNFDGKFVSGGSYANIAAMACARNKVDSDIKKKGFSSGKRLVAFVSKDAHYCFLKSANLLGIGTDNVVAVDVDANGSMAASDLEKKILTEITSGATPFFIAATLGTTVRGAFDNIDEIAKIAKKYNIWLHGDGAYGGAVLFSKKHKYLLAGIEKLDSFAIDFHKIIGAPLVCSALVFNDKDNIANDVFDIGSGEYLFHNHDFKEYDQGTKSLQCGRKVDALKIWLMMLNLGFDGLDARIDYLFDLAKYAAEKITADANFKILFPPNFLNICFQFLPDEASNNKAASDFNEKLRYKILQSGSCFINYSTEGEIKFFRLVTVNFNTTKQDIDDILSLIKTL